MGGGAADQGARYLLREKLLSIGDDFWIENDQGERIFYVDAKVLRVRDTSSSRTGPEMNWSSFRSGCCGPAIPWPSSAATR
jgi:hypothetical protein